MFGADRQIRDSCTPRRDLTIPGKHRLGSDVRCTRLGVLEAQRAFPQADEPVVPDNHVIQQLHFQ